MTETNEKVVPLYEINTTPNFHPVNLHVLKAPAESMVRCYGPYGFNAILDPFDRGAMNRKDPKITRDGVSIFNQLRDNDGGLLSPFLISLKQASSINDIKGGDGTTSTILFLYKLYKEAVSSNVVPSKKAMDYLEHLSNELSYKADNWSYLVDAAKVSLNNRDDLTKPLIEMFEDMDRNGMDWRDIDIIPIALKNVEEEKVFHTVTKSIITHSSLRFSKNMKDTAIIYFSHGMDNTVDYSYIVHITQNILKYLAGNGIRNLVIATPHMDDNLSEQVTNFVNMMATNQCCVDIIDIIDPLNMGIDGSDNMAVASYIPIINPYGITQPDEKGLPQLINPMIDSEKLNTYIINEILPNIPIVDIDPDADGSKIVVKAKSEAMVRHRDARLNKLEAMLETATPDTAGALQRQIRELKQESAILFIGASTDEMKKMLYDMYRDACLQMRHAKKGVIGAGNVGIARLIQTAMLEYTSENKDDVSEVIETLDLLHNVAVSLTTTLIKLKNAKMEVLGKEYHMNRYKDIVDNLCRTSINRQDPKDVLRAFNLITDKCTKNIITSAHTELNIVKSAVDMVHMWMTTNQIVWNDLNSAVLYRMLGNDMNCKDIYADIL